MLCQLCENIKLELQQLGEQYEHHPTWSELVASARNGCQLCRLLEREFRLGVPSMDFDSPSSTLGPILMAFSLRFGRLSSLNFFIPSPPAIPKCLVCLSTFQHKDGRKLILGSPVAGRDFARSSASETCFQWAEEQIKRCLKEHKLCRNASRSPAQLPTRVLDLDFFDKSDDLRLHESCGETGSYVTLSHCWGGAAKPLVTELATIHLRHERIPFGDLPRSFQDAVKISRALKIRYLWIDTLCIIQDSIDDWAAESAQMARIYKSALLTISFAGYQNPYQPILCDRPELLTCQLGGEMSGVHVRSKYPSDYDATSQQTPSKILDLPSHILGRSSYLGRRAWAFQERLLSPRVLNYTTDQLIWECQKVSKCESCVMDIETHMKMPDSTEKKDKVYRFWLGVVESFTQCDLTYPRDKFPALSGIASEIGALLNDIYLVGMWKSALHEALLWRTGENASLVTKYRAPSWSWATFDGDIIYDTLKEGFIGEDKVLQVKHRRDMVVLGHKIHPIASDPWGLIDGASLSVQGYCAEAESVELTARSKSTETVDLLPLPMKGKDNAALLSDWVFDSHTCQQPSRRYVLLQVSRWAQVRMIALGNVDDDDGAPLDLDSLGVDLKRLVIPYIASLILAEADNAGEYRRVGIAKIGDEHRGKIRWEQRELTLV